MSKGEGVTPEGGDVEFHLAEDSGGGMIVACLSSDINLKHLNLTASCTTNETTQRARVG